MASRREQNRLETRARVLEAAKRLFADRGVSDTTAADLAAAARISRATYFNHFGSKEELLVALWEEQTGTLDEQITAVLEGTPATAERVRLLFGQLVTSAEERPGYLEAVAFELERVSSLESIARRTTHFHGQLRRLIDAGIAAGDVRTDHDPAVLAEVLGAVYVSLLRNLRSLPGYDLRARAAEAAELLAGAVCRSAGDAQQAARPTRAGRSDRAQAAASSTLALEIGVELEGDPPRGVEDERGDPLERDAGVAHHRDGGDRTLR